MSHLSTKSKNNLLASSLLIKEDLHSSSVHCSYYAMLQHMTCKMKNRLEISYETIISNSKGPGSHNYVIGETMNILKNNIKDYDVILKNVELTNIQKLKSSIGDLKLLRVHSDYHNLEIDSTKSSKALKLSQDIILKLNKFIP
jgi:hypothetical protein